MSLSHSLQIGRSGLLASQAAIAVTGNNLANIATRGYHRQTITLAPDGTSKIREGVFLGRGVQISAITRQINEALEGRLRSSISDEYAAAARQGTLQQLEAIQNELSGVDLSTRLSAFFNAFSNLANNPQDNSLRTLAIQESATLASFINNMRGSYDQLRQQVTDAAKAGAVAANDLLTRIEHVTRQIIMAEGTQGGAAGLRDERDGLLSELSQYLDISVNEHESGAIDVFVGSLPIMLNGQSRGVELRTRTIDGNVVTDVVISQNKDPLDISSGELGALIRAGNSELRDAFDALDAFTHELIWQVNRLHSQGQGVAGFSSITGTSRVLDENAVLDSADAGLDFKPQHGSFLVHVTQKSTGQRITTRIDVDLDEVDPSNNTTLSSLIASINGVDNVTASLGPGRQLVLAADASDFEISFSEDSSGVLAALGVGTLFSGKDSYDVAVNPLVQANPRFLAAGLEHVAGDNRNALAIADLRSTRLERTGGLSLTEMWSRHVEDFAIRHAQARGQVQSAVIVRENLEAQQQSVSGVNADEEAINLLAFQRMYQASARFLSIVDEMMQTLLRI
jgi:flagellar hook-associated protein 1 FlgK